jgi:hypothetical protein
LKALGPLGIDPALNESSSESGWTFFTSMFSILPGAETNETLCQLDPDGEEPRNKGRDPTIALQSHTG